MIFRFGNAVVDIDIEKTGAFYQSSRIITDNCSCEGCQYFVAAAEKLDCEILEFFKKLGIDILKPAEIIAWCSEDNGQSVHYGGWYHICGQLISDMDCWSLETDSNGSTHQSINESNFFSITDNFSVGFTSTIYLMDNDFPKPVVQMEILIHHFPWVLNTSNKFEI